MKHGIFCASCDWRCPCQLLTSNFRCHCHCPPPTIATAQPHKYKSCKNIEIQKCRNTKLRSLCQLITSKFRCYRCTPMPFLNCCPSINTDTNTSTDNSAEERIRTQIQFSFPLLAVAHRCSIVVLQLTFLPGAELSLTFSTILSVLNSIIISTLNFAIFSSLNFGTYLGRPGHIF